jgi:hypothetical protein
MIYYVLNYNDHMNNNVNLDLVVSRYEHLAKAFRILEFRHILNPN